MIVPRPPVAPGASASRPRARLGPYEVRGLVGAGGMGEVYRAFDPRLQREVAVKVLPPEAAADADRVRRFEAEARAAGALGHPNILAVHDVGAGGGVPYVVAELLEGETLAERLQRGPLTGAKTVEIGLQITRGLAAAHEKGIVHRDLKPGNLFLTRDGQAKILDFGLAKLLPREPAANSGEVTLSRVTAPGMAVGTVGYMSPEQAREDPVDHRSDIFSLGAVVYEMLAGHGPFARGTSASRWRRRARLRGRSLPSRLLPFRPAGGDGGRSRPRSSLPPPWPRSPGSWRRASLRPPLPPTARPRFAEGRSGPLDSLPTGRPSSMARRGTAAPRASSPRGREARNPRLCRSPPPTCWPCPRQGRWLSC